jgi:hypothetical protein
VYARRRERARTRVPDCPQEGSGWLYHRDGRGLLLGGTMLIAWVLEPLTIAVDQWVGVAADPTATYVSTDVIPIMLGLATVMALPAYLFLRSVRPRTPGA